MATLNAAGLGSNLDVNGIVTQLMSLERRPVAQLDQREASYKAKLSAYGTLKGALAALQAAAGTIATPTKLKAVSAIVADTTLATVTANASASAGTHSLEVKQLAQAHRLKSEPVASADSVVGTGTITIQLGTYAAGAFTANANALSGTVTISGTGSLGDIRDAINAAGLGVTANLVNDGTGTRLALASKDAGVANAIRVTVADNDGNNTNAAGLSALAYDATTGGTQNLSQTAEAKDAWAVIDGIDVYGSTNKLSNAVDGLTINLAKAAVGTTTTVTVARDAAGAKSAIESFVKAWNDAAKTIKSLTAYDPTSKTASILTGDATVASVRNRLRDSLNAVGSVGGFNSFADIGIKTSTDGSISLDATKLDTALADPTKDISALFAAIGTASASGVSLSASTKLAEPGAYAINLTQASSRGFAVGNQIATSTITAGVNDTLSITVNGVAATVTLAAGSYTAAQLVTELQAKVNGASALRDAGATVSVAEAGGILTVASSRYGADSSVAITGGNAASDLFGAAASTGGTNVAGTIGGVAATGMGQVLTASGLSIAVTGSATGARGTLTFTRGVASRLSDLITELTGTEGAISSRTEGLNASVLDIAKRRDAINARLELTEKRLRAQFTALDTAMSRMTTTSTFLTNQLAALAGNSK